MTAVVFFRIGCLAACGTVGAAPEPPPRTVETPTPSPGHVVVAQAKPYVLTGIVTAPRRAGVMHGGGYALHAATSPIDGAGILEDDNGDFLLRGLLRELSITAVTARPRESEPPGIKHDNVAEFADIVEILDHWGAAGEGDRATSVDSNGDGAVDAIDLEVTVRAFLRGLP